jgi:hypothetical protein
MCLVVERREPSGADSLPWPFEWRAVGAEQLPDEYTLRCGFTPSLKIRETEPLCSRFSLPSLSLVSGRGELVAVAWAVAAPSGARVVAHGGGGE